MKLKFLSLVTGLAVALSAAAQAQLPEYADIELQARSNLIVNDDGWNVPPGTSFTSITPAINDGAQVSFTAGVVPEIGNPDNVQVGIWLGGQGAGEFVALHEEPIDNIANKPGINSTGELAYYTSQGFGSYTLWQYDPDTASSDPVNLLPSSPSSFGNINIDDDGNISFKAKFGLGDGIALADDNGVQIYATDSNVDSNSPYVYIYSPDGNNNRQIAVKVSTIDYNHNEIRLFHGPDDSELLVADKATDPDSPFAGFDNGLALNNHGDIAVIVNLDSDNTRAIYRFSPSDSGVVATEIARVDSEGPILELDFFAPAINDDGLVAFRARDENGQAIYVGNGDDLTRVAGQSDVVDTDLGVGQIGQHDDSPIFSGAPAINSAGDIAFVAGLHPDGDSQVEWGTGVMVAYAEQDDAEDGIFHDRFEAGPQPFEYAYDDGAGNTNQGPSSAFDPDMLWGNYFAVEPGGEVITQISVAFGPTFPSLANGPVNFWLLEDSDADFDPLNATVVAHVQATPDTVNDEFFTVDIPPTEVQGAFFVGASAKLLGGQDRPARVDTNNSGENSWFFCHPDITAVIDNLADAEYHQTNDETPAFPGSFMVRATGIPVQ